MGGRHSLRPLLAAVALAVAVAAGGVAGGLGLHGRHPASATSATSPPPSPSATARPVSPYPAAPRFTRASAVWDSTDKQIVVYDENSQRGGTDRLWTWQGSWIDRTPKSGGLAGDGFLVDAPGLHGVAFVGSQFQLWSNGDITQLPVANAPQCMSPLQGVWDAARNQLVVVFTDQCTGGTAPLPGETWTYDGHMWHRDADVPSVRWPMLAWDPGTKAVALLGSLNGDFAQAWTWTGTAWTRGPASRFSFPSPPGGAGWDAAHGALVVWAPADNGGQARAQQYSGGVFKELIQDGYPERTEATIADSTHGRLLAIGQMPIPAWAKPSPDHEMDDYHVLEWTGSTWVPISFTGLSAPN